jgi:DNA-binding ferritin-like protein (Dps family)
MNEVDKMRKENLKISRKLNKENYKKYKDIVYYITVGYCTGISINLKEKEEITSDILDMFLRCEEEGKPIEEVIGNDHKAFCDSIIQSVVPKENKAWYYFNRIISEIGGALTIYFVIIYIPTVIKNRAFVRCSVNKSNIIPIMIFEFIGCALFNYFKKNLSKLSKRKSSKKEKILLGSGYGLVALLIAMMAYKLPNCILFSVSAYYVIFILVIFWLSKLIINHMRENNKLNF